MGLTSTTTNLSYARNELLKVGVSFIFDKVGDMIYYMSKNNDIGITFAEVTGRTGEGTYLFANGLPIGMATPGDCQGIKMEFDYGVEPTVSGDGKGVVGLDIKMTMDQDWDFGTKQYNATVRAARLQVVSQDDVSGRIEGAYINAIAEGTKEIEGYISGLTGPGIIGVEARTEIQTSATITTPAAAGVLIFHYCKGDATLTGAYRGLQIELPLILAGGSISGITTAIYVGSDWGGANAFTTAIDVAVACAGNALTTSAVFQHGSYSNAVAYAAEAAHLVLSSIHVSATPASGIYIFGHVVRLDTTENTGPGHFIPIYGYSDIGHNIGAVYTIRGRTDLDGTITVGQVASGYFQMNLGSTAAISAGTGPSISGVWIDMSINGSATVAAEVPNVAGIHINANSMLADLTATQWGIFIECLANTGYLDAGICIASGSNSKMTSAIKIHIPTGSDNCEQPYGVEFDVDASGSQILHAFRFAQGDKTDGAYVQATTITDGANADGMIKIDCAGTDYYIPFYDVDGVSNEWTDQS